MSNNIEEMRKEADRWAYDTAEAMLIKQKDYKRLQKLQELKENEKS